MVPDVMPRKGEYAELHEGHPMCSECAWHVRRGGHDRFCFKRPPSVAYDYEHGKPMSTRPKVYDGDPACGEFERFDEAWEGAE